MTIINLVQNNNQRNLHLNATAGAPDTSRLLHMAGLWVSHLVHLNQKASEQINRLEQECPSATDNNAFSQLNQIQKEQASCLHQLAHLLKNDNVEVPPNLSQQQWIGKSLEAFFESWHPEIADLHLWLLTRPLLLSPEQYSQKERDDAVSFYELSKMLIQAAWALHQHQIKLP